MLLQPLLLTAHSSAHNANTTHDTIQAQKAAGGRAWLRIARAVLACWLQ
jgi:hypothetical protein